MIVDESFTLLADSQIQHMLRCALYSGVVDWRSHGNTFKSLQLPESFRFDGRIIFNTNATNGTDPNHKAMLDRAFYNRLLLTGEQIAVKMIRKREYAPDRAVWRALEDRLLSIRHGKVRTRLAESEKRAILSFTVHRILQISRTYNTNLSVRILERVEALCLFLKQLFGALDMAFARKLARHYFVISDEEDFVKKVVSEAGGTMASKDLAVILRDTQGYSLRTAQRRIEEYVELGKLVVPKRGLLTLQRTTTRPPRPAAPPAPSAPSEPPKALSHASATSDAAASMDAWDDFCGAGGGGVSPVSPR